MFDCFSPCVHDTLGVSVLPRGVIRALAKVLGESPVTGSHVRRD